MEGGCGCFRGCCVGAGFVLEGGEGDGEVGGGWWRGVASFSKLILVSLVPFYVLLVWWTSHRYTPANASVFVHVDHGDVLWFDAVFLSGLSMLMESTLPCTESIQVCCITRNLGYQS